MNTQRFVISSSIIASLGGLLFGFDTAVISGAEKAIQNYFGLSGFWHGFTISSALIGTIIGAIMAYRPADTYGRKFILMIIALMYAVSAIGSALAHSWYGFLIYRFLGGLGVGASSVIGPMFIAEISPARLRGRLVAAFQLNIVGGILMAYLSNYLVVRNIEQFAWRWMLGVETIPAILFFFLLFLIPSSPRWLVLKGKDKKAKETLNKLGSDDAFLELREIKESIRAGRQGTAESFFSNKYRFPIILAILMAVFNQISGINAVMYYAPRIFESVGVATESALLQSVSVGLTLLVSTMAGMALIDRVGRKTLLLTGAFGMAVFLGLVAKTIFTAEKGSNILLLYLIGFIVCFGFSHGTVIWVYISEIFPNKVRAKGQALGSFTHWIMAAAISWIFPVLVGSTAYGGGIAFSVFAGSMLIQVIVIWIFFPETKGKSLEAIQKSFLKTN